MQLTTISGESPLAFAIRYALTRMERLSTYLGHGILELDNRAMVRRWPEDNGARPRTRHDAGPKN